MFCPVLVLIPLKQCYVKASILSLLSLFSLFVPLSGVLVYMCSVVNIGKVVIKCCIARIIHIAECIDTQTVICVYYSVIFLHIVYCLEISFVSILRHREGGTYEAEDCALLGYHAVSSGNFLLTFQDSLSVPS